MTGQCSQKVFGGTYSGYLCARQGTVTEDGKPWCKQHAPSAVRARRASRDEKWAKQRVAENARIDRKLRIANAEAAVYSALEAEYDRLPEMVRKQFDRLRMERAS